MILGFDIHHKVFRSGNGKIKNSTSFYEIRTSPTHADTIKSIICKSSHPDNNSTIQFIPYGIQALTNKYIYKTTIKKKNAFIPDNSVIPVPQRNIAKFIKLIEKEMCTKH